MNNDFQNNIECHLMELIDLNIIVLFQYYIMEFLNFNLVLCFHIFCIILIVYLLFKSLIEYVKFIIYCSLLLLAFSFENNIPSRVLKTRKILGFYLFCSKNLM